MSARVALEDLKSFAKKGRVSDLARFYKTAPGEYGEGDLFLKLDLLQRSTKT